MHVVRGLCQLRACERGLNPFLQSGQLDAHWLEHDEMQLA